jgi:hypothetical protein
MVLCVRPPNLELAGVSFAACVLLVARLVRQGVCLLCDSNSSLAAVVKHRQRAVADVPAAALALVGACIKPTHTTG